MEFSGFDWDSGNKTKCQKHGVSPAEIEYMFEHEFKIAPDPKHSLTEERLKAIGRTKAGRNILVTFTKRERGRSFLIRPVSARYMHQREVDYYEKETSNSKN